MFVNGDDGVIRGLEVKTGKIIASLQGGHEVGSKIRSIWVCIFWNKHFFYSSYSLNCKNLLVVKIGIRTFGLSDYSRLCLDGVLIAQSE